MVWSGRGLEFSSQAEKDLIAAATIAFDHGDQQEQATAAKSWRQLAEEFWLRTAADDAEKKLQAPKLNKTGHLGSSIIFHKMIFCGC